MREHCPTKALARICVWGVVGVPGVLRGMVIVSRSSFLRRSRTRVRMQAEESRGQLGWRARGR
jgi:hypothetical protein